MSQVLTLELSDEVYAVLKQQAEIAGISLAEWLATSLERQCGLRSKKLQPEAEKEAARQRFRRHAGTINPRYTTGADNQSTDADLAVSYNKAHE